MFLALPQINAGAHLLIYLVYTSTFFYVWYKCLILTNQIYLEEITVKLYCGYSYNEWRLRPKSDAKSYEIKPFLC
jgi:hypothetical protein